jgi:hypothetical protein
MDGAVESDIALIKQSIERDAASDDSAPTSKQEHPTDARIGSQGWVSQLRKVVSVWSLGPLCQSICQYAQVLMR